MGEAVRPTTDLSDVAIIIPALNEAEGLAVLLPLLVKLGIGQIIVADNGSTDRTGEVARAHGAKVAREPQRGYGAACQAGLGAMNDDATIVAFMDADLSDDPAYLNGLIEPCRADLADLVIGYRAPELREPGSLTIQQRFGNWLATRLIRIGWGKRYFDLGPFRAVRRSALDRMGMSDRAYGWTVEMQIRAVECGLRVLEIPVPYRVRKGKSKISGTVRGVILAGYWILRTIAVLRITRGRRLARRDVSRGESDG